MDQSRDSAHSIVVRLFGGATIEEDGRPLAGRAAHRHALGLLALLSGSPGHTASREKLIALLWPEANSDGVRHRLNVTLYELRQILGKEAIVSVSDDLRLDPDVIAIDVAGFEDAVGRGDPAAAVELYRGPFLDGFHLPDAFEFDEWASIERERLARAQARCLESLAEAAEALGDVAGAARWWRQLAEADRYGSRAVLGLMQALATGGERAEALRAAERHARILEEELGTTPDPAILSLAERTRKRPVSSAPPPALTGSGVSREGESVAPAVSRRRPWVLGAAAVAAGALLLLALPRLPGGGTAEEVASDQMVILPFTVRGGADYAYLGEGMAEILAATLDGVGALRTVDPHAVLAFVAENQLDPSDPSAGRRVAERFGAGAFVLGSIVESGRKLRIQATLYGADGAVEARGTAGAGADAEFFQMVDDLSRQLLASRIAPEEEGVTRLAITTSSSLPALRAYLAGESRLRAGEFEAATEAFRRATRADSTFALAWYRQAVAAEWAFQPHAAAEAVAVAVRMADRLPERYRLLLVGWNAYAHGQADRAEAVYERVLDERPESVEAWLQLGEIQFHYAPSRGRTIADSRKAFERVLELDPSQEGARIHLARIAALSGDVASLDAQLQWLEARQPRSHATFEARGLRAFAAGDPAAAAELARDLRDEDSYAALAALLGQFYAGQIAGSEWAAGLLATGHRPLEVRTAGWTVLALTRAAAGRMREAAAAVDSVAALDPLRGGELHAIAATLPFLPTDRASLSAARVALARGEAIAGSEDSFFLPDHDGVRPLLRSYLQGLVEAGLGNVAEALREAEELEHAAGPEADPALARDLARGVRAEVHRRAGRVELALAELDAMEEPPGYELVLPSPFQPRARERYLRARLLEQVGRDRDALAAYLRTGNRSLYDLPYRGPIQLQLGALLERTGDRGGALEAYRRSVGIWERADPLFQRRAAAARSRLGALADVLD